MASEFVLDPVAGIPDPPTDESTVLEWTKELTEAIQKDHVANVDRTETMVMINRGLDTRPESTGSRRFFHDAKSGVLYLDTEISPDYSEWVGINVSSSYSPDGLGVHVLLSTSLPWSTATSGYFSWDAEEYDEADDDPYYWVIGDPTVITIPETRSYNVVVEGKFDNLAADGTFLCGAEINGTTSILPEDYYYIVSTGTGEEYTIKISFIKELILDSELKIGYKCSDSVDVSELSCIVTPVTLSTGGGGEIPSLTDHGALGGRDDDDHLLYLRNADTGGSRAAFATDWTDLTDNGETLLHTHPTSTETICLDAGAEYQIKNTSLNCQNMISFDSNIMTFGNTSYSMNLRGSSVNVESEGSLYLIGDGTTSLSSSAGNNITLSPGSAISPTDVVVAQGDLWMNDGNVMLQNNNALTGEVTGGTDKILIRMNENIIEIGDNIYANVTEFVTNGAVIMDEPAKLRIPYLTSQPTSLTNGDIWMESDGLHVYYGGTEHTLT